MIGRSFDLFMNKIHCKLRWTSTGINLLVKLNTLFLSQPRQNGYVFVHKNIAKKLVYTENDIR